MIWKGVKQNVTMFTSFLKQKDAVVITGLAVALVVVFLFSLSIGQMFIPVKEIGVIFLKKLGLFTSVETDSVHETVLWSIRLPRLVMTTLIGVALGVSGAALQGLFRNPLVEPGLIGVSSGASLAVVSVIVFGAWLGLDQHSLGMSVIMPLFAFGGGLLATLFVMQIGRSMGPSSIAMLILAGVAVNALCGAAMGLAIFNASENQLHMFMFWTLGDLGGANWSALAVASPVLLVGSIFLLRYSNALNAIALGESEAFHMGVDVNRVKKSIVFLSALTVGTSVSMAGAIGFVGLVVPHLVRVTLHSDNKLVMPASAIGGPLLLILADMVARTMYAPTELPIGVMTALIGTPFFIFLLIRSRRKNEMVG
ncbi:MAG TPA: iron ABC transporter permease [Cyclobacteriaceae bacterium]|nr:iron ABC transporter permease [Cyclobacteriaceae bacterium]